MKRVNIETERYVGYSFSLGQIAAMASYPWRSAGVRHLQGGLLVRSPA